MANIKLSEAVSRFIDKRTDKRDTIIISIPELISMIQSAYDWDEFGDLSYDTVFDYIVSIYGCEARFSLDEAEAIVANLRNNGYHF